MLNNEIQRKDSKKHKDEDSDEDGNDESKDSIGRKRNIRKDTIKNIQNKIRMKIVENFLQANGMQQINSIKTLEVCS